MRTIGLTTGQTLEVITTYTAPLTTINAAFPGPNWTTVGAFWMPIDYAEGGLEVIGLVSSTNNELHVRLYDITAGSSLSNSEVVITSNKEDREVSQPLPLKANHLYRVEMAVIGISGTGTILTAGMS